MAFCLPKEFADKFTQALKEGKIVPEELIKMTSDERRAYFAKIVGEKDAQAVNSMFESKLLLKDQKRGLVTWAKKVAGITEATRTDLLSKIERMDKVLDASSQDAFLKDLAATKLGADVTFEEATNIVNLTRETTALKEKIPADSPIGSAERLAYGIQFVKFQKYVSELKGEANALSFKEWLKSPSAWVHDVAGTTKSLLSSLDNSFFGRQGIKMLFTNPGIWGKAFLKSWGDITKGLAGIDAADAIKADIYSRPNAISGKYDNAKVDIGISNEEAFPSSLPERVPILGRLYKASENAFQGAALRMRADYADKMISKAEEFGVDFKDKEQAQGIGKLVNSMTGRGSIGKLDAFGKEINSAIFSIKFLKSNLDVLTAHRLGYGIEKGAARDFVRKEAATNLAKIVVVTAGILFAAEQLNPGSVELDPRSAKFGKIKIGNAYYDISGGMASIIVLASRLTPTMRNGKWGFWSKSATTGKWADLTSGKYGQQTALDVGEQFLEGKLSPLAGLARDVWKGKNFQGEKVTPENAALNLVSPLSVQSGQQINQAQPLDTPEGLSGLILDGLGFTASTYQKKK